MRALVLEGTRRLAWHEVPDPQRRHEREAIVRPLAVAACDLDWLMIFGQTPFQFPIHLGMSASRRSARDPTGSRQASVWSFRFRSPAVLVNAVGAG